MKTTAIILSAFCLLVYAASFIITKVAANKRVPYMVKVTRNDTLFIYVDGIVTDTIPYLPVGTKILHCKFVTPGMSLK